MANSSAKKKRKGKKTPLTPPSDKLNAQQERFCREYLTDYNGTAAASRAGYSERSAGVTACRLLKNPKVLARVRELQHEQAERLAITADWTLLKLRDCVVRSMQAEPVMEWDPDARELVPTGEWQFDSRGATKALELIGKHLGMYQDKFEMSGDMDFNVKIDYGDSEPEPERERVGFKP